MLGGVPYAVCGVWAGKALGASCKWQTYRASARAGRVMRRAWNEDRASFVPRLVFFIITLVEKGPGVHCIGDRFLVGTN